MHDKQKFLLFLKEFKISETVQSCAAKMNCKKVNEIYDGDLEERVVIDSQVQISRYVKLELDKKEHIM